MQDTVVQKGYYKSDVLKLLQKQLSSFQSLIEMSIIVKNVMPTMLQKKKQFLYYWYQLKQRMLWTLQLKSCKLLLKVEI